MGSYTTSVLGPAWLHTSDTQTATTPSASLDGLHAQPLPVILDQVAKRSPDRTFITAAEVTTSVEGVRYITFRDAASAVNKIAAWLDENLGEARGRFPTYAFMSGPFDLRYLLFVVASIKSGHKIFILSPKNNEQAQLHLLDKLNIKHIVSSIPVGPYAEKAGCSVIVPPTLDELMAECDFKHYHYTKSRVEAVNDQIVVMHSSGSNGLPKPITWTNAYVELTRKMIHTIKSGESFMLAVFRTDQLGMLAFPLFHTAGLLAGLLATLVLNSPMICFPANCMLNAQTAIEFLRTFNPRCGMLPPLVLEDIAKDDDMLKVLDGLSLLMFGGAAIGEEAGKKINQHTQLISGIGTTEASMYPLLMPLEGAPGYSWFRFEALDGFTFRKQISGLYELVIERSDTVDWPIFHTFPDLNEYDTKDLYEKHPTIPLAWKIVGRKDDVLVLSSGEKVIPAPMEGCLRTSPDVSAAIYFGHNRSIVGALIELTHQSTTLAEEDLLLRLQPFIEKANRLAPSFAHLAGNMIVWVRADKPVNRAPKGSVIRATTISDYNCEIEASYLGRHLFSNTSELLPLVVTRSRDQTEKALIDIFCPFINHAVSIHDDLFSSIGINSTQVISAARIIRAQIQVEASEYTEKIIPGLVYKNPTIERLANAIRTLVLTGSSDNDTTDDLLDMEKMVGKYGEAMPKVPPSSGWATEDLTVLLTGSTGSLGSYLLSLLIGNSKVSKIFALNRSQDAFAKQEVINRSRGLSTDFQKVTFVKASMHNKNLGLSTQSYHDLASSVDVIIHNAWPVDFNQSLHSFDRCIGGIRNLIDLAACSALRPRIVFISSIGTTNSWELFYPGETRPEALIDDPRPALGNGYTEAKWVGERLMAQAAANGISSTILRVGQIAGPVDNVEGSWQLQEWLPSIIISSAHMGKLPKSLCSVPCNWIPVDRMAKIVIELAVLDCSGQGPRDHNLATEVRVFNLVNPIDNGWGSLVDCIVERIPTIRETVAWSDWVQEVLSDSSKNEVDLSKHPAVKLATFYEGMAFKHASSGHAATNKAVKSSTSMAALQGVSTEWMTLWLTQWGY